jgi:hypothetical protein
MHLGPASRRAAVAVHAAAGQEVKLFYRSGWGSGRVHGSVQGGDWKDYDLRTVSMIASCAVLQANHVWPYHMQM